MKITGTVHHYIGQVYQAHDDVALDVEVTPEEIALLGGLVVPIVGAILAHAGTVAELGPNLSQVPPVNLDKAWNITGDAIAAVGHAAAAMAKRAASAT